MSSESQDADALHHSSDAITSSPDGNHLTPNGMLSATHLNITLPDRLHPASDRIIAVRVGERTFTARASTLTDGSTYFASLLSGRWQRDSSTTQLFPDIPASADAIFVDADGDTFEHVLRHLRTGVMPLFYTRTQGFDHGKYRLVQEAADYFGVNALAAWIKMQRYREAVQVMHFLDKIEAAEVGSTAVKDGNMAGDSEVIYFPRWRTDKVYLCPRRIAVHEGKPEMCGRQCRRVRGDDPGEYRKVETLEAVRMMKLVEFKPNVLIAGD